MKRTLTIATLITLAAASYMPMQAVAQNGYNVIVTNAPPAPRYESVPAARAGYVWAPGYWNWEGNRHVWTAGRWEAERRGYRYQRTEWVRDNNGYRLQQGGWQQIALAAALATGGVQIAPPAPRYERTPRARRGYIWAPGHWEWRNNRHQWVRGQYVRERQGYRYMQPTWVQRDGQWYLEQSRWSSSRDGRDRDRDGVPDRYEGGRDRDRDGVPDRLEGGADRDRDGVPDRLERRDNDRDGVPDAQDRDRDNDGVRNRNDGDRDGDGIPNDRDRYPDDRTRR
ncbi:MAG: hypothetical protein V4857_05270 [Pseudomonadota bacterium]